MVKDMSCGNPVKLIISFAIPLIIGNIFQQFYSMVDTVIVGRFVSVQGLAALGATGSLNFLVLGFIIGLANGFGVIVAQRFGAENYKAMRNAVAMGAVLSLAVTLIVTLVSTIFVRQMLELMQTPEDVIDLAEEYIFIIFAGIGATMLYNFVSSVLRALGDSRTPLYFLVLSSIINVVLDLLFILKFHMGVSGAAWATIISQAISFLCCFFYMRKKFPILRFDREDWRWNRKTVSLLLNVGIPMGLQSSVTAIGCVIVQGAINSFGSVTIAAFTAATKVEQLVTQPMISIGLAIATFTGQNLGAGKLRRIREGVKHTAFITLGLSVVFSLLIWFLGTKMVYLFVSEYNKDLFDNAQLYLRTVAAFLLILSMLFIFRSALQGLGNALVPMLSGIFELVMRFVAAFYLVRIWGYFGVCIASPIAWIAACILLFISFYAVIGSLEKNKGYQERFKREQQPSLSE